MPGTARMSDPAVLRTALEARRGQLIGDLQRRVARIRENGSDVTVAQQLDDGDSCDIDAALVDLASTVIDRIDQALGQLEAGTYGLCTQCRGPIGEARLRALPFAVCCRRCQATRETANLHQPGRSKEWPRGLSSTNVTVREEP